jgi:hypothetical protein
MASAEEERRSSSSGGYQVAGNKDDDDVVSSEENKVDGQGGCENDETSGRGNTVVVIIKSFHSAAITIHA